MPQSPKEFAALLTKALHRIKKLTGKPIYQIEDDLGIAIYRTRETIEKWRRGELPAELEQIETVAKLLFSMGGLVDREEFENFLNYGGQARAAVIWKEENRSTVDSPAPSEHFVGREDKIAELVNALLDQETNVISLWGPGGVGKTALITAVLEQLAPSASPPRQFPDGILYYNFYGNHTFEDACHYIGNFFDDKSLQESLAQDKIQTPTAADIARRALRNKQALIVLDGAEEADDLNKLLDIRDRNKVLIVTRFRHKIHGRTVIGLNPPLLEEAVRILKAWSAPLDDESGFQVWEDDSEDEHAIAVEICELTGCLPLALRLAGRYMVQCETRPAEYRTLLRQTPLLVLHEADRQHESVYILLKSIIEIMRTEALNVLAVIGLLAFEPFHPVLIMATLRELSLPIQFLIGELDRFGLVNRLQDGGYQVAHRLIHTYCREHLDPPNEALGNLVEAFFGLYSIWKDDDQKEFTLERERGSIIAVLGRCVDQELWEHVSLLTLVVYECFPPQRFYKEDIIDTRAILAVGIKAAQITELRELEAFFLMSMGKMHYGRYTGGSTTEQSIYYYNQALIVFRQHGEKAYELECLQDMSGAYSDLGQWKEHVICLEAALPITRELGYDKNTFDLLISLESNYFAEKKLEQAHNYLHEGMLVAIKLVTERGDYKKLDKLKTIIRVRLDHLSGDEKGIKQQLLDLADQIGYDYLEDKLAEEEHLIDRINTFWEAEPNDLLYSMITIDYESLIARNPLDYHLYSSLALIQLSFADPEEALVTYQQRIEMDRDASIDTYAGGGICAYYQGDADEAHRYFEIVLAMWEAEREKQERPESENTRYTSGTALTLKQAAHYLREQRYFNSNSMIGFKFFALVGTDKNEEAIAVLKQVLIDNISLVEMSFAHSTSSHLDDNLPFAKYIESEVPLASYPQEEIIWVRYLQLFVHSPNPPEMMNTLRGIVEDEVQNRSDRRGMIA